MDNYKSVNQDIFNCMRDMDRIIGEQDAQIQKLTAERDMLASDLAALQERFEAYENAIQMRD